MNRNKPDVAGTPACKVRSTTTPGAAPETPHFVMVHGIGMSHRYFDLLQPMLADYGHTHVLDLPGFGGTPTPAQQMSVEDYAVGIGQALDATGIRSCVLIGHSMGAQFATELALQRPDLVTDLILLGPVTDPSRRSVLWHTFALAANSLVERPLTNTMVLADYARCGLPWYFTELPVMLNYSIHERLPLASQRVLVIRGGIDTVARGAWCESLATSARDGRLVEIPGQPHVAHRGGATEVTGAIISFLGEAAPQLSPANRSTQARRGRGSIFSRVSRVFDKSGSAHPPSVTTEFYSILVGDRQCRAYLQPPAGVTAGQSSEHPIQKTFVFIHGIGMSHRYFRRLSAELADHGESYLIDLPGYGWTGRPAEKLTNTANAELIGALLDQIGAGPCVVVGHSMGVQSATELAISRPDLVSSVVLIGPAIDAKQRTALRQAPRLAFNSLLEKPLLNSSQFLDVLRCGPRWYLTELAVAIAYHLEERIPLVEQPVLVMRGTRDHVAGAKWARSLVAAARNGELLEVPGSPHAVHHSAPEAVAAGILSFVARLDEPVKH